MAQLAFDPARVVAVGVLLRDRAVLAVDRLLHLEPLRDLASSRYRHSLDAVLRQDFVVHLVPPPLAGAGRHGVHSTSAMHDTSLKRVVNGGAMPPSAAGPAAWVAPERAMSPPRLP